MPNRFYPGDPCPKCAHPIKRGRRTIWHVFLREAYLTCPNCSGVFVRFLIGASQETKVERAQRRINEMIDQSDRAQPIQLET